MLSNQGNVVGYILLNRLQVSKANSLSGGLVYGFPAVTAFKGLTHAISRKIASNSDLESIGLRGVLVACHGYELYGKKDSYNNFIFSQFSSVADVAARAKRLHDAKTPPPIAEEAYVDIVTSLVFEVVSNKNLTDAQKQALRFETFDYVRRNRVASGVVDLSFSVNDVQYVEYEDLDGVAYTISDSFVLTDASEIMRQYLDDYPDQTALDALIHISARHINPVENEAGEFEMKDIPLNDNYRNAVPIATGFKGIAPAFSSQSFEGSRAQGDSQSISQYVECIYGLGTWELPHILRLKGYLRDAFWVYNYDSTNSLYTVSQPNITAMHLNGG